MQQFISSVEDLLITDSFKYIIFMRYIVSTLFFCFLSFSQTNDSIYNSNVKNFYDFNIKLDSLIILKPNFNYNFKTNYVSSFSVYNRNTKLNDVYCLSKDSIYFVKTVNFNSNQSAPKDSFNPNGASNLGVGLIMGSINTVFNSIFKK
jgi:hypothetical protein